MAEREFNTGIKRIWIERTREQNSSHEWKVECSKRLSSFFGKICKMNASTSCANVVKDIRYQVFMGNSSTNRGVEKWFNCERRISFFVGVSPDGFIGDDQIIEVKCPSSAISMPPLDALAKGKIKYLEMKDGKPQLKLSHN
ncbi:hypothetical protein PR048_021412 [Dryococelus australis]|uniref:YqaJ viral recombinase domain-containing protein n=1 Tax=Dryococelus australis TaxID=614101 RepID=A0ABQ9GY40_9NEOP|nr:hypothetical protein PR048_021412 [Dryococelus australis]